MIGYALGFDQHRSLLISNHPYPTHPYIPALIDAAAWFAGIATLGMLIGGFFFGEWWWPVFAMFLGTGTNFSGRAVMPMEHRWLASLGGTAIGLFASTILFKTF